jgi:YggT family protein
MWQNIFSLIIDTFTTLYLMVILLRFVLQLARADFYNPISQFIVKATNPLVMPFRKIIPGVGGVDLASLVLAFAFQFLMIAIKLLVLAGGLPNIGSVLAISVVLVLGALLKLYFWSLLIMIVASWIAPGSSHPILLLINQICEPIMQPFRRIMPNMGGLDLSPILVFLSLQVLSIVLSEVARQLGFSFALI